MSCPSRFLVPHYVCPSGLQQLSDPVLAAVTFGAAEPLQGAVNVSIPMHQLGSPHRELWMARRQPEHGRHGGVDLAHDGALLFGTFASNGESGIERVTRDAYAAALAATRAAGYPNLLRMWNHVGSINAPDDGLERYRRFCAGRYDAFAAAGYELGADLPSASAVGMDGRGLVTYFIAARSAGVQVENPRQVSAYRYPPEYGPRSPSFSRATVLTQGGTSVVYVAGTSSVVGHASTNEGDITGQVEETIRNLEIVVAASLPGATLRDIVAVKTYIRHEHDFEAVKRVLSPALSPSCEQLFLQADICRAELLVEVEAVACRAS